MPKAGTSMRDWGYKVDATNHEREGKVEITTTKEEGDPIWVSPRLDML